MCQTVSWTQWNTTPVFSPRDRLNRNVWMLIVIFIKNSLILKWETTTTYEICESEQCFLLSSARQVCWPFISVPFRESGSFSTHLNDERKQREISTMLRLLTHVLSSWIDKFWNRLPTSVSSVVVELRVEDWGNNFLVVYYFEEFLRCVTQHVDKSLNARRSEWTIVDEGNGCLYIHIAKERTNWTLNGLQ